MAYEKIYIQKMGTSTTMKETSVDFGLYGMEIPFHLGGEAKELPSNDWPEYDGEEEYVPTGGLPLQAYEIKVRFGFKNDGNTSATGYKTARKAMRDFRDYLTGRDAAGGVWMYILDEHTGIGRQKVRFVSMDDEPTYYKGNKGERLFFEVTLKVCDPVTDVIKSNGNLTVVA
jgi:hypothetical protein